MPALINNIPAVAGKAIQGGPVGLVNKCTCGVREGAITTKGSSEVMEDNLGCSEVGRGRWGVVTRDKLAPSLAQND